MHLNGLIGLFGEIKQVPQSGSRAVVNEKLIVEEVCAQFERDLMLYFDVV